MTEEPKQAQPADPVVEKCEPHGIISRVRCSKGTNGCMKKHKPAEPPAVRERAREFIDKQSGVYLQECSDEELMAAFAAEELSAFVREVEAKCKAIEFEEDVEAGLRRALAVMRSVKAEFEKEGKDERE